MFNPNLSRSSGGLSFLSICIFCSTLVLFGCGAAGVGAAEPLVSIEPLEDPAVLLRRGQAALAAGDSVRSEQYLVLAMNNGVARERVVPLLIRACLDGGRLRAALGYAEAHLTEHPEQTALRFLVATIHAGLGQDGAAIVELKRILDRNPGHAESHYLLGFLLEPRDPGGAREHFQQYLEREPQGVHAAAVQGWLAQGEHLGEIAMRRIDENLENARRIPDFDRAASRAEAASREPDSDGAVSRAEAASREPDSDGAVSRAEAASREPDSDGAVSRAEAAAPSGAAPLKEEQ